MIAKTKEAINIANIIKKGTRVTNEIPLKSSAKLPLEATVGRVKVELTKVVELGVDVLSTFGPVVVAPRAPIAAALSCAATLEREARGSNARIGEGPSARIKKRNIGSRCIERVVGG